MKEKVLNKLIKSADLSVHFVGIGGIGMSGLAMILKSYGYIVTGSDLGPVDPDLSSALASMGIPVSLGHRAENVTHGTGLLVYSTCIKENNEEMAEAVRLGIPRVHRSVILNRCLAAKRGIGITGAHGKTTSSALTAFIYERASLNPSACVGGIINEFRSNVLVGDGPCFIAEVDESDGSHAKIACDKAVILNSDFEHPDFYSDTEAFVRAMYDFSLNIREGGLLIYNRDDRRLETVFSGNHPAARSSFAVLSDAADLRAVNLKNDAGIYSFDCIYRGDNLGRLTPAIKGRHNIYNVLASVLTALDDGISFGIIKDAVSVFTGTKRRFQHMGRVSGIDVIEDYAHHPTEISAVLSLCRDCFAERRIVSVFQPHRFSRTKSLAKGFAESLLMSDVLLLTDVYSAFESPGEGAGSESIYNYIISVSSGRTVALIEKEKIIKRLSEILSDNDVVLVLGAGDINSITAAITDMLRDREAGTCDG